MQNKDDISFMGEALSLAKVGQGKVSPNPLVGCVIVENNEIISKGYHEEFGKAHAEVNAIKNLGNYDFSNCTIYVTLEPCSHFGKTPPCADLIIEKKFKRVVVATTDPNPLVAGTGIQKIKEAGIEVETSILEEEAKELNKGFFSKITTGMPFIFLKVAQTIDGFICDQNGVSKWITNSESRKKVHELRASSDAILIGSGTVIADNPSLDVRDAEGISPWRIILSGERELNPQHKIFTDQNAHKTIVVKNANSQLQLVNNLKTVNFLNYSLSNNGEIDLKATIKEISDRYGFNSIMIEGGSKIYSSFIENNLYDEIHFFIAPKILAKGISSFSGIQNIGLGNSINLQIQKTENLNGDLYIVSSKNK